MSSLDTHCIPAGTTLDTTITDEEAEEEPTGDEQPVPPPPGNPPPPPGPGEKGFVDCLKDAYGIAQGASSWVQDHIKTAMELPGGSVVGMLLTPPGMMPPSVPEPPALVAAADDAAASNILRLGGSEAAGVIIAGVALGLGVSCGLDPGVFGDPHFVTLDGLAYDIQSAGEFHLLREPESGLDVQARFEPRDSSVSTMTALAIQADGHTIEFRNDGTVLIDGDSTALDTTGFFVSDDFNMTVTRSGADRIVALDDPNLLLRYRNGALSVITDNTPTEGLLGNNNGDPSDDLITRTGETPGPSADLERFIHTHLANSWRITNDDSAFTYAPGEDTETFTDINFPEQYVHLEDYEPEEIADAEAACAGTAPGSAHDACVLDVLATGSDEFVADAEDAVSAPVGLRRDFDDQGQLSVDFEGTVPLNFASTRMAATQSGTTLVGPMRAQSSYEFTAPVHHANSGLEVSFDLLAIGTFAVQRDRHVGITINGSYAQIDLTATAAHPLNGQIQSLDTGTLADGRPYRRYRFTTDTGPIGTQVTATISNTGFSRLQSDAIGIDNLALSLDDAAAADVIPIELGDVVRPDSPTGRSLTAAGQRAVYQFTVPTDDTMLQIDPLPRTDGGISDCSEWQVTSVDDGAILPGCMYTATPVDAGTYRLEISPSSNNFFPYTYAFHLHAAYAAEQFDAVDVGDDAVVFSAEPGATSGPGIVQGSGDDQLFTFNVTESGLLNIDLECLDPDPTACGFITSLMRDGGSTDTRLRAVQVEPGIYHMWMTGRWGPHRYRMTVQVQHPTNHPITFGQVVKPNNSNSLGVITGDHQRERFTFEVTETTPPLKLGLLDAYPKITGPYGQNWVCDFWQLRRTEDDEHFDACLPGSQLPPGHYTLDVYPSPSETLPYRYGFELHTADAELHQSFTGEVTPAQPWTVIPDASTGEGTLGSIGDSDTYTFTTDQFGTLHFALTCAGATEDRCPDLSVTAADNGWVDPDHVVARPGTTVTAKVSGGDGGSHDYGLTVSMTTPADYQIGDVVSEGSNGPGTGVFNTGRDTDLYAFDVPSGGEDVNLIGTTHTSCWAIQIYDATSGEAVDTQCWEPSAHLAQGNYVAVLSANDWYNENDLPYSFLLRPATEPQGFTLVPGTDVAPATETGTLDSSADRHLYSFTVPDDGDYTIATSGAVFTDVVAMPEGVDYVDTSTARVHLTAGDYQVQVSADSDSIVDVPYTLAVNTAPTADTGAYSLGDTLTPSGGSGLGVLETSGSLDQLTFSLATATPLALSLVGIPCSDLTLSDAAGSTWFTGCDFDGFAELIPAGDYTMSIASAWGEASEGPVPYSLTARAEPEVTLEDEVILERQHEDMSPNVVSTINNTLDVQSFAFHVSADDQNTQNFLIIEQGVGCQNYRILQAETVLAQGSCENTVLWYPQEGDYQLQVTGDADDEFSYYLYLGDEIPDGFIWPGGGGGGS